MELTRWTYLKRCSNESKVNLCLNFVHFFLSGGKHIFVRKRGQLTDIRTYRETYDLERTCFPFVMKNAKMSSRQSNKSKTR